MITVQCQVSNGPFSSPSTYPAEANASGTGVVVLDLTGAKHPFGMADFNTKFKVVGQDRTPSGHRSLATATIESTKTASELVERLLAE